MKTIIVVLAVTAAFLLGQAIPEDRTIQITVWDGNELVVTVPNIVKRDMVDIVGTFFGKGDEQQAAKFKRLVGESKRVTLVLRSQRDQ